MCRIGFAIFAILLGFCTAADIVLGHNASLSHFFKSTFDVSLPGWVKTDAISGGASFEAEVADIGNIRKQSFSSAPKSIL